MPDIHPEIRIYAADELPDYLDCQIRSFIRIMWYDAYKHERLDAPLTPAEWHPTQVTLADHHVLVAYAGVVWRTIEHKGQTFKLYGLTGVFTYPAFRGSGYGRQVVDAATRQIDSDPDADLALLWTDPKLEGFYNQAGWEHMPTTTVLYGNKDNPEPHPGDFPMMRFLSAKGKAARPLFENNSFYFAEHGW